MDAWLWGFIITGSAVLASIGGMLLVRRSVELSTLESHHQVAGFIYAVVGVLYAVLLAFVVITVWERFEETVTRVAQEANELGDLYRSAEAFPEATRGRMRERIVRYARLVIEEEWPAMARGTASPAAWEAFDEVWRVYLRTEPGDAAESIWYAESLDRLEELSDDRRLRLLNVRSRVRGAMWATLLLGGAITIAFSYLFGTRYLWAQTVMVGALSGLIALIFFLILALDNPFAEPIRVEPAAFRQLLEIFEDRAP